jgi:CHASE2 domain-containing sensor protein
MAVALAKLQDLGAVAIGVDIYRDIPIRSCGGKLGNRNLPRDNIDLAEVSLRDDRIVWVSKPDEELPIAPPAYLIGTDQVAAPDIPPDVSGIARRVFILYSLAGEVHYSLSYKLALRYLRHEGIGPTNDPDQTELMRLGETTIPMFQFDDGG